MKTWKERRDDASAKYSKDRWSFSRDDTDYYELISSDAFEDGWNAGRTDALREVVTKLKDCGHWGDVDALEKSLLKDLAEQEKEGS